MDIQWARSLQEQCATSRVPFFFKQAGALRPGTPGPPDIESHKEFP